MQYVGTYNGEEMTVIFTAKAERCDYGVERSPVWYEVDPATIEVHSLEILGRDVKFDELPEVIRDAILDLSDEVEFENEE